jgi:hypothetical protein
MGEREGGENKKERPREIEGQRKIEGAEEEGDENAVGGGGGERERGGEPCTDKPIVTPSND